MGGSILTLDGDIDLYVDGDFQVSGGGQIDVTAGSNVTIHHGSGLMKISGNAIINMNAEPETLNVLTATTTDVTFSGGVDFYGTIYAPQAQLNMNGSAHYYGGAVAKRLNISNGFLHQDLALGKEVSSGFSVLMMQPFTL